jgi:Secretion system C-terminal sorting domain
MKKTTLLIALLFATFMAEAQVIVASQNFNTTLGWTTSAPGWARVTTGVAPACSPFEGAGMARFNSYDLSAGATARLTSPAITLTGATYRVKLKMYRDSGYQTDADNIKVYINTTALSGGTLLGTVNRSISLAPAVSSDGWYSYSFDIPGTITGTRYVNILGTGAYGNNIFIDNVTVEEIPAIDSEMSSLNLSSIVTAGMKSISGVIKNFGSTTINSLDLKWQADSGTIYTQNLTGLNIAPGATYNYTHSNQWNATPGLYSIKVWTSNINGGSGDSNVSNDQILKSVSVASNSTTRRPLYEKFTSSTCGPCAGFNGSYFTPFYGTNGSNLSLINYQVNWPGSGDPYYTAEVGSRRVYYNVSAAPTLFVDSTDGTNSSVTGLQSDYNSASLKPAYFAINATKNLVGNVMTVNVTTTPYLDGTYKLYVVVVEKTTTGNIATNGETSFKNVMMKMMPDANGTVISCTHDVPVTNSITTDLTGTNIEQYSDLEVVVFVQNNATREIMQSTYAIDQALATDNFSLAKIKIYPNPSNGLITVDSANEVDITVTDLTGKVVYVAKAVTNQSALNLSALQKGVYLVKMSNQEGIQTEKIILK